jgi:hypothetical protein
MVKTFEENGELMSSYANSGQWRFEISINIRVIMFLNEFVILIFDKQTIK